MDYTDKLKEVDLADNEKLREKREKEKFKRIWKNYRWTKEMYLALGAIQGWRCAACGREAGTMPLNIDHEHFKVVTERYLNNPHPAFTGMKWIARVHLKDGRYFEGYGVKKADAIAQVRELALPASVRGLLCAGRYAGCNRKFGRIDDPVWLRAVLDYVLNPPARRIEQNETF